MTWAHPLTLLLVPAAVVAVWWTFRRVSGADSLATFAHIKQLWADRDRLVESSGLRARRWRGALLAFGLVGGLLALARPQWGSVEETTYDQAREVLIALDLSRSMLAEDVAPTRLARAKLLVEGLLDQLHGERVGLTVFAGTSFLQSPMSADYEVLRDFLTELEPAYLPQGGTDYQSMLTTALKAFGEEGDGDRYLVVLSDGEAHDEQWKEMIPSVRARGIRVIGLGVGTAEGAVIPDVDGGLMKDEQGAAVLSRLEPKTLQELTDATGGTYRDAATWVDIADLVKATVDQGQKGRYVEEQSVRLRDQYQWFLAPALLVLLLSYWLDLPVFPVARVMRQYKRASSSSLTKAAAVIALVLVCAGSARATTSASASAPEEEQDASRLSRPYSGSNRPLPPSGSLAQPPSPVGPAGSTGAAAPAATNPLEAVVGALAAKPDLAAADYAALATTTIELASQPGKVDGAARNGVIDDALRGVGAGEALDDKAADWPALRQQLEALKQPKNDPPPPPEQQQDQKQDQQEQQQSQGGGAKQPQEQQQDQPGDQDQQQPNQDGQPQQNAEQKQEPNQSGQGEGQPQAAGQEPQAPQAEGEKQDSESQTAAAGGEEPQQPEDEKKAQAAAAGEPNSGEQKEPKALNSADAGLGEPATPPDPATAKQEQQPQAATRMVGGGRPQDESIDGKDLALTDAVDRMNRIKDGDAPAVLFDRMNQAEGQRAPEKNGKNW